MKAILLVTPLIFLVAVVLGQSGTDFKGIPTDTLERQLMTLDDDVTRVLIHSTLIMRYLRSDPDRAKRHATRGIALARRINFKKGEANCLRRLGLIYRNTGRYPEALNEFLHGFEISKQIRDTLGIASGLLHIGEIYAEQGEYAQALPYFMESNQICRANHFGFEIAVTSAAIGRNYVKLNDFDSALRYLNLASVAMDQLEEKNLFYNFLLDDLGFLYSRMGNDSIAKAYYQKSIHHAVQYKLDYSNFNHAYQGMASLFEKTGEKDSCIYYARKALEGYQRNHFVKGVFEVSQLLYKVYDGVDEHEAFEYFKLAKAANDSLFNSQKVKRVQQLLHLEQQRQQRMLEEQARTKALYQRIALSSALGVFLLIALLLWRNNRLHRMTNQTLSEKNDQIEHQRQNLEMTLTELKNTQTLLIAQEQKAALYQQQLKIEAVRNSIATELHDDIGSTLSSIYLSSEVAKKKIRPDTKELLPVLERIESSSQEMIQAMSEIVWAIQPKNDDTLHLVDRISAFAHQLLSARNIDLRFEHATRFPAPPIAMEVRRNIYLICKETLNNVVKHARATQVSMEVEQTENNISIRIRDDGQGFDDSVTSQGNGMANIQWRAAEIGGNLQINSRPGQGTSVWLKYPLT